MTENNEIDWAEIERVNASEEHIFPVDIPDHDSLFEIMQGKLTLNRLGRYCTFVKVLKDVKLSDINLIVEGAPYGNLHDFFVSARAARKLAQEVAYKAAIDQGEANFLIPISK